MPKAPLRPARCARAPAGTGARSSAASDRWCARPKRRPQRWPEAGSRMPRASRRPLPARWACAPGRGRCPWWPKRFGRIFCSGSASLFGCGSRCGPHPLLRRPSSFCWWQNRWCGSIGASCCWHQTPARVPQDPLSFNLSLIHGCLGSYPIGRIPQINHFLRSFEKCQVRRVQKIEGAIFYGALETPHGF